MLKNKRIFQKSTCLSEIYKKFEDRNPDDFIRYIPGKDVENVEVIVENIEKVDERDFGFSQALVNCRDGCGKECYVRFCSEGFKIKDAGGKFKFGAMEPGMTYRVSGSTLLDKKGKLIITISSY